MAIGSTKNISINRNYLSVSLMNQGYRPAVLTWKSPKFEPEVYRKLTEVNWIAEYKLMYLKQQKLVTRAARPSLLGVLAQDF